ncbi:MULTISPECIES: DNA repair protein RadC [unclassified Lentimonas]|uniref:RadC family protein n=1 Tax=unclassified Lentimonas TaxID=2630993 RepID=UPI001326FFB5|nr:MULTISPECIES: DNA repair protein RadC [unclassified Lentimonas]CAA6678810.1 DNA repair protein RadC [Lentimonas sp. CC4]CAA6684414.1 DNA repair protein RadC [Lentimonas sp. CC6]CAA6692862.1 DNA repair protein RadC [Lentimonas sp. CC19]CAA6695000.1 DNA repair protein RadC [Lentimonas sp. CC10]CAA7069615.1 DNA repair protein RadC [Lentimonas sp. CC11]
MSTPYPTNRRMKDMVASERPQERLAKHGAEALSDSELLAMILRSGPHGIDVLTMSSELINKAGSLTNLLRWSAADFQTIKGIGTVKSLQLMAVMDFARRILKEDDSVETIFDTPEVVARHFRTLIAGKEVEHFWALCLDRKNRLIQRIEVSKGTASSCLVHPREVFKEAIKLSASAIIVVHNHPSGDPAPSRADIQVTRQLREAAKIIGIDLIDHIVVGQRNKDPHGIGFYSFNEAGLI